MCVCTSAAVWVSERAVCMCVRACVRLGLRNQVEEDSPKTEVVSVCQHILQGQSQQSSKGQTELKTQNSVKNNEMR